MDTILSRTTLNPLVNHGKPSLRNTRYSLESILEYLAAGDTIQDLLLEFQDLEEADILACIAYASASMKLKDIEVKTL